MRNRVPFVVGAVAAAATALVFIGRASAQPAASIEEQGPESIALQNPVLMGGEDPLIQTLGEGANVFHATVKSQKNLSFAVRITPGVEIPLTPLGPGETDVWVALQPLDPHILSLGVSKSLKVSITTKLSAGPDTSKSTSDYRIIDNPFRGNRGETIKGTSAWKAQPLIGDIELIKAGPSEGSGEWYDRIGLSKAQARRPVTCDLVVRQAL